jgi:hypothetical protein
MKLILLIGEECGICDEAKAAFDKQFGREQAHGEAKVVNIDTDQEYQEKWMENDLEPAPVVILENDEGKIISIIPPEDLLNYKPTAAPIEPYKDEDLAPADETPPAVAETTL